MNRYRSLDGLRGIAALVVVVHHCLLVVPSLANAYKPGEDVTGVAALFAWSPLHLLWAGGEAVLVFFVLSGFVLTVAADGRWANYYPRRLVRLYLPVIAAIAFAVPFARFLWTDRPAASWWLADHTHAGGLRAAALDATLLNHPGRTITPIWSLEWEVWFSLLLPAYLLLTRATQRQAVALGVGFLALMEVGERTDTLSLRFLPVFALGVLLARHREAAAATAQRRGPLMLVVGLLLLIGPWCVHPLEQSWATVGARDLANVGAVLVVAAFLTGPVALWSERKAVVQWLGKRSFSLYLIHEPVVVTVALLLHGHPAWWAELLIVLPLSLALAEVFGRLVEVPSHRASKRVGAAAEARSGGVLQVQ